MQKLKILGRAPRRDDERARGPHLLCYRCDLFCSVDQTTARCSLCENDPRGQLVQPCIVAHCPYCQGTLPESELKR